MGRTMHQLLSSPPLRGGINNNDATRKGEDAQIEPSTQTLARHDMHMNAGN